MVYICERFSHTFMYLQKIIVSPVETDKEEKTLDLLHNYLGSLRQGGHIFERVYPIIRETNALTAFVLTPETNSLEPVHENKYTKKGREQIENFVGNKLVYNTLGVDPQAEYAYCDCETQDFLILCTTYVKIGSPLRCGDCFGQIPLYKLKKDDGESHYKVLSWETNYKACDDLQMNCTVGERFCLNQMSDLDSQLTQEGLERCEELAEIAQKPVYYYLFNYRKISEKKDKTRKCPQCGGDWLLVESMHRIFDFKCDTCRLLSSLTYNS